MVTRLADTAPAKLTESTEARYGNRLLYFQTAAPASGEFSVDVPYRVARKEVRRQTASPGSKAEKLSDAERKLYLGVDSMVPTSGKPLALLSMVDLSKDKFALARQLYDIVDQHVAYKKEGVGWGRGDVNWVCDNGYGNCTDFHSLFMSLARSQGLPARFEIGFSIPNDKPSGPVAGYHCWAWFYADGRGWIPVDISEADKHPELKDYYFGNLTADRMTFSVGRDLELVPKAAQSPRNFLVYPHIEVGGKALPAENIELQFAYTNDK
jgi:transglutaminase-like putative cysteine protease